MIIYVGTFADLVPDNDPVEPDLEGQATWDAFLDDCEAEFNRLMKEDAAFRRYIRQSKPHLAKAAR